MWIKIPPRGYLYIYTGILHFNVCSLLSWARPAWVRNRRYCPVCCLLLSSNQALSLVDTYLKEM